MPRAFAVGVHVRSYVAPNVTLHGTSPWHLYCGFWILLAVIVKLHGTSPWHLRRLGEKVFDQPAIVFFFDSSEHFEAKLFDRGGLIEWQAVVHLSAAEVTRHALRLKDRFHLGIKINPRLRSERSLGTCGRDYSDGPSRLSHPTGFNQQQHHR